jgi:DNA-binding LacI/PurR family transcriptional regulator
MMQTLTLSQQIRKQLCQKMIDGLSKNDSNWILPPLRKMAHEYDTTTMTMKKVIDSFKEEGVITTQRGRCITVLQDGVKIMRDKQRRKDIGFFFPEKFDVSSGYISVYLNTLFEQVTKYNYGIRLLPVDSLPPEDFYKRSGGNEEICGFIGLGRLSLEYISFFQKNKIPFVWLNNYIPESSITAVILNKLDYFTKIVDYILEEGYSDVCFIEHSMTSEDKDLLEHVCLLKELPAPELLSSGKLCNGLEGFEWAYNATLKRIQNKTIPDLIIVGGESGTYGVINAAHDCGIAIPEKVKILPLVDNIMFRYYCPLKTDFLIRPVEKIVNQGIKFLDSIINGKGIENTPYTINCEIIRRQ